MSDKKPGSTKSLSERIAMVERKLELRRERALRHFEDARTDVSRAASIASKWLPLVGVASALAVGITAARRSHHVAPQATRTQAKAAGILATIVGVGGTLVRVAASPQVRALWSAWRAKRARPTG